MTCRQTIPLWLSYVDFTFTIRHQGEIDAFPHHLNEENADKNLSEKPKRTVDFLNKNFLTSRDENTQRSVFRSATNTDRLLDESSYNPTPYKARL